jgi:hypothetical protein
MCLLLLSATAWGQQGSGVAGAVTDSSGAVLPGVTVEASSPALIEGSRTAITDGQGRYNIVDLRPGTYVVSFALGGFRQVRREGIQLTAGFTASINAVMQVGALEETVTVTAASPLVDTQNVRQQKVFSDDVLEALPSSSRAATTFVALTPGLVGNPNVGGAGGIQNSNAVWRGWYHGKAAINHHYDGTSFESQYNTVNFIANPYNVEEVVVETGGVSADTDSAGVVINMIPKDGGNTFTGYAFGFFGNDKLQSNNLTDELRARGLTGTNEALYVYDSAVSVGGPIRRNKAWFYVTGRRAVAKIGVSGLHFNQTQGSPFYTPDLDRPAYRQDWMTTGAVRLTWQVSDRNKLSAYSETQYFLLRGNGSFASPEAAGAWTYWPEGLYQVRWTSPITNKLLLEAAAARSHNPLPFPSPGDRFMRTGPNDISIVDALSGFRYNAPSSYPDPWLFYRNVQRASISYVTGSHALKAGFQLQEGGENMGRTVHGDVNYAFLNGQPSRITQFATPYVQRQRVKAELGLYIQDKWTVRRLSLNYGLRFDYWNGFVPAQHIAATQFLPERNYPAVYSVPAFTDVNPRLGAAYDLFGNGRTALKLSLGRYVAKAETRLPGSVNPITTSVNSVNRIWNDNGNYIPDCDLRNPDANGECGAFDNRNFGQRNISTRYADDVFRGFGTRNAMWDLGAEVQHQLRAGVSLSGGYYRNWAMNFTATDNQAVSPTDYSPYCVMAPLDPRLPGGGGYQVCGLYDVAPAKFGLVDNLVSKASSFYSGNSRVNCGSSGSFSSNLGQVVRTFGGTCGVSDYFNVGIDARVARFQIGGGLDTGRTVLDNCFVVDSPQQLLNCRVVVPFRSQTQIKSHASYTLPRDFRISAMFQNVGGPEIEANYLARNAEIAPSLGRDLAACRGAAVCNATVSVPLITPLTQWETRRTQLDLRFSRRFALSPRAYVTANLDIYNALNASSVLGLNHAYGPQWLRPIGTTSTDAILSGRFFQFSGELAF